MATPKYSKSAAQKLKKQITRGKKAGGRQGDIERGNALINRGKMGGGTQGAGEIALGKRLLKRAGPPKKSGKLVASRKKK